MRTIAKKYTTFLDKSGLCDTFRIDSRKGALVYGRDVSVGLNLNSKTLKYKRGMKVSEYAAGMSWSKFVKPF